VYQFGFPQGNTPLAALAVEDTGKIVAPLFEEPGKYIGRTLKLVGDEMTADEYAAIMSRHTGVDIRYAHVPRETFAALGFPGAEDLADMFEFYRLYMPRRTKEIAECRAIAPDLQTFETWMSRNAEKLRATLQLSA
jgi:hypothetical protein